MSLRAPAVALGLLLLLPRAASPAGPPSLYGPGRHFLDRVAGGFAAFGAEASVGIDVNFDGAPDLTVAMTGTTEVFRSAARVGDPTRAAHHRNHLDLEIFSMTLAGIIPRLGPLTLRAGDGIGNLASDGPLYSHGTSDEIPGSPRLAQDFFDIFFTVEFQGVTLHNAAPLRVAGQIDRLPPIGTRFTFSGPPLPLVDANGTPVLQITDAANTAVWPPPRACEPAGADRDVLAAAAAEVRGRCGCGARCAPRLVRARIRTGLLNPSCRRQVHSQVVALCRRG